MRLRQGLCGLPRHKQSVSSKRRVRRLRRDHRVQSRQRRHRRFVNQKCLKVDTLPMHMEDDVGAIEDFVVNDGAEPDLERQ